MKTTENNKLIAEFMGLVESSIKDRFFTKKSKEGFGEGELTVLKFHSDWNWLMQVVEKIESLGYSTSIMKSFEKTHIMLIKNRKENLYREMNILESGFMHKNSKIEAVYQAVVEFVKWYNENKTV